MERLGRDIRTGLQRENTALRLASSRLKLGVKRHMTESWRWRFRRVVTTCARSTQAMCACPEHQQQPLV
jgi:hypothetical protein